MANCTGTVCYQLWGSNSRRGIWPTVHVHRHAVVKGSAMTGCGRHASGGTRSC